MIAKITAGKPKGSITAVPSKSFLHRMLICAALCPGESRIGNYVKSEDILASIDCIKSLGACVTECGNDLLVKGMAEDCTGKAVFPCRESGSTLRFFIPVAAARCAETEFTGSERLMERGVGIYEDILASKGVNVEKHDGRILVKGRLKPGLYEIPGNISSQYITGLMFALPLLDGDSEIRVLPPVESRAYIDITVTVLKQAGIEITETKENVFFVKGNSRYMPVSQNAEGDWSNAAFLYAMNGLGAEIEVGGLNPESVQGDRICLEAFGKLDKPGAVVDIGGCIDLGPVLFAYAAAKHGGRFTGTKRLKIKESDRGSAMAAELAKFGVRTELDENEIRVIGGGLKQPAEALDGHNDHRIVMALAVLLTVTGGSIAGAEAVKKSYPGFFDDMRRLGLNVETGQ